MTEEHLAERKSYEFENDLFANYLECGYIMKLSEMLCALGIIQLDGRAQITKI